MLLLGALSIPEMSRVLLVYGWCSGWTLICSSALCGCLRHSEQLQWHQKLLLGQLSHQLTPFYH